MDKKAIFAILINNISKFNFIIMKKTLLVLASLLMTMGSFADEVTFDFVNNGLKMFPGITVGSTQDGNDQSTLTHDGDITENKTATIDGVSLEVTPSGNDNAANRIWTVKSSGATSLRYYGGTMTFTAPKNIKSIEFTDDSKWTDPTPNVGSFASKKVWTGDAASVTLTFGAQCRIKTIKVSYGDNVVTPDPTPTIENTPETAYTTAKALELIAAGEGLDPKVYVKGIVSSVKEVNTTSYGNATFSISDDGQAANELVVFRAYYLNNKKFVDGDNVKVGDNVIVYGHLVNYTGKDGSTTPELEKGYIYKLNDATAINGVAADKFDVNAPIYNLAGQRVTKAAKGILIQNGKKFIVK